MSRTCARVRLLSTLHIASPNRQDRLSPVAAAN